MHDQEIDTLREYAQRSSALGNQHVSNLTNRFSVDDYRQMADEIKAVAGGGRLLDWGCGYGHMSYLLARRGFEVRGLTAPDDNNLSDSWNLLIREQELDVTVADDEVRLPFEDETFDAVLSCGVLEHVPDEAGSTREILRVLRPGGYFFVYQLPNWLSAVEWASEHFVGVAHERRYRPQEVRDLLSGTGFSVSSMRHGSMIPKNLDRVPVLRKLFDEHYRVVRSMDGALLRIPGLNLFSGTWEVIGRKPGHNGHKANGRSAALGKVGSNGARRD